MLKPGGYLQWTEMEENTAHIVTTAPMETLESAKELLKLYLAPSPQWPARYIGSTLVALTAISSC